MGITDLFDFSTNETATYGSDVSNDPYPGQ